MAKRIYLEGGGDIRKEENDHLDSKAIKASESKSVYVIDLTSSDENMILQYRNSLESYFKRLGAEKVDFVSTSKSFEDMENNLKNAGLIYLPGGNTNLLLENIKKRGLENLIKESKGILVGNSAGAMVLCKEAICVSEEESMNNYLGILDISIDVHYRGSHDKKLEELSKVRNIYAISEKGAIIFGEEKSPFFVGDVYLFSKGEKTKVN